MKRFGVFGLRLWLRRLDLRFAFAFAFGFDLLDILQRQFQLIDRKRLGASSEPVTLERLDDRAQAFHFGSVSRALGDQRRLERLDVVGNSADRGCHQHGLQHVYNSLRRPHAPLRAPTRTLSHRAAGQFTATGTLARRLW